MKPNIADELFKKYYNEALLYTVSLCRNITVAEDVVSTAFCKAVISEDDEIKEFKPWLLAVCRNEFFSLCRKKPTLSLSQVEERGSSGDELAERVIKSEEYQALYKAIGLLGPPQREAITLFYFSNLSVKQIAAITDRSETNVKVLLYRGRERLRALMEDIK